MRFRTTIGIGLLLLLGVAAVGSTALQRPSNERRNQVGVQQLPITIKQLQPENNTNVELLCGTASITPPNILNEFHCVLKNNTNKRITAANIIYSTVLEEAGQETRDSRNHILTTYIHPDFYDKEKNILPGGSTSFSPAGVFTYENAVIKGVEVYLDFVEFEDHTSMGPNEEGSRIINDLREGAVKYKSWLARESKQKSIDRLIQSLQSDEGLQLPDVGLNNITQREGARRYGIGLRKLYKKRGPAEVQRYLSTTAPGIN